MGQHESLRLDTEKHLDLHCGIGFQNKKHYCLRYLYITWTLQLLIIQELIWHVNDLGWCPTLGSSIGSCHG